MDIININDQIPDSKLILDGGKEIKFSDFAGKKLVIYFYPKDDTPGCTKESKEFAENYSVFQQKNTEVIGVSKDSVKSHDKFKAKYELPFHLISDESLEICKKFGVWVEKSMYGRKYMGIDRSTFLVDESGKIIKIWRKVKVTGHVKEVLEVI